MKTTRFFALLLVLVMAMTALTSCFGAPTPAPGPTKPEGASYKMKMKMTYSTEDARFSPSMEKLSSEADIYVDGENMMLVMEKAISGITIQLICVDGTAYTDITVLSHTSRQKATITEEQQEEFLKDVGVSFGIDVEDFQNREEENKDGKQVITCTGLPEETVKDLIDHTLGGAISTSISAKDIKMIVELSDGKYDTVTLSLTYEMDIQGETVEVGAVMEMKYDYENGKTIEAPSDASSYETVDFEDIFG